MYLIYFLLLYCLFFIVVYAFAHDKHKAELEKYNEAHENDKSMSDFEKMVEREKIILGNCEAIYAFALFRFIIDRLICFFLFQPVFFFPFAILVTFFVIKKEWITEPQDIILFITFLSLIWYARETMVMRQGQNKK